MMKRAKACTFIHRAGGRQGNQGADPDKGFQVAADKDEDRFHLVNVSSKLVKIRYLLLVAGCWLLDTG
jgi:hypothetical protein